MPWPNLGGTGHLATVFKLNPTGHETVLYSFTGLNGAGAFPEAGSDYRQGGEPLRNYRRWRHLGWQRQNR